MLYYYFYIMQLLDNFKIRKYYYLNYLTILTFYFLLFISFCFFIIE